MSRAPELRRKKLKKISGELYSTMMEHNFGDDSFGSVQLLSMNKPGFFNFFLLGGPQKSKNVTLEPPKALKSFLVGQVYVMKLSTGRLFFC